MKKKNNKLLIILAVYLLALYGCSSIRHGMITQVKDSTYRSRHTNEYVKDTNIHIKGDSALLMLRYKLYGNNQLELQPIFKSNTSIYQNLVIDTMTKTITIRTIMRDTVYKIMYKNTHTIDTFFVSHKEEKIIEINSLNKWQKIVQGFGYAFFGLIMACIAYILYKILKK